MPDGGTTTARIGSAVVGYWQDGTLISAGGVGTGFTDSHAGRAGGAPQTAGTRHQSLQRRHVPRETRLVEPRLVCEVAFTEWAFA